ncbi:MAG: VOC family protein [Myxococcota bacterium]
MLPPRCRQRARLRAPAFALWLEADDLQAAYARACAAGGRSLKEPDDEHFEIADPDGNPIEVWRRRVDA